MGIANRRGDVPSIDVSFRIDGRPFKGVLHSDGELVIQNRREQQLTEHGKLVTRWWLFTNDSFEQLQKKSAKRGERLVVEEPDGRHIEFVPESFMPLDFINSLEAKRTAAKVALTCVAQKLGQTFACLPAFDSVRDFVRKGEGDCARLFFNQNFAEATQASPFQHLVILSCDARKHTVYAIVMFFGTMTYLVQLSSNHQGIENERLAVEDILGGRTQFGDVVAIAEHGARVIQSAASPRRILATRPSTR
jgi:hypothetical protein